MFVSDPNLHEKTYPPAYTEIYPAVPVAVDNGAQMGWQPLVSGGDAMPSQQPTTIVTQQPIPNSILHNQSRIGLYPIKLQPCPHCQTENKTMIKQESTIRTHLLALILCAMW